MNKRIAFTCVGVLFSIFSLIMILAAVMDTSSNELNYNLLTTIALAVFSFTLAYLLPEIQDYDERGKLIRTKAIKGTFISVVVTLVFILIGYALNLVILDTMSIIIIIMSGTIIFSSIWLLIIAQKN
ncbi:hypothetical protein [Cytobacillus firmus]|uniref:hypothetical protein n=1 Tax=Cytobacillus firmus TaxID=1399 RepID=UPI001C9438FF|nr:hypothetical protein [Cytobacillus firmus]MBY6051748.1 hypothetical protein [Cytobacillus firmus]